MKKGSKHTENTKNKISSVKKGCFSWNKGLTKEIDIRLVKSGQKQSITKKKKYASGEMIVWNKGNHIKLNDALSRYRFNHDVWNKGLTKETDRRVKRQSELLRNHNISFKTKKKISKSLKGKSISLFHKFSCFCCICKAKRGETRGKNHANFNKKMKLETRKKIRKTIKALFKDKKFIEKWAHQCKIKPNKSELYLQNILNILFPQEYKYVGDFQFWLGGKNPDFMNINGQKKLIELFGNYWHKNDIPKNRINYFKKYGFNTLVIWENELKDINRLNKRLEIFHKC